MSSLLDASAMEVARRIRTREVSIPEVVNSHIDRIEHVNPAINAVIADRFERARAEAEAAQKRVMTAREPNSLPPLLGIPYTAKEYIKAKGMPLSAGIWSRRKEVADCDATTIERLRDAGAILVGITNVPEGGLWMETYNPVYGRTLNPWNPKRTAGGSSGGEGAIVAAGGVPLVSAPTWGDRFVFPLRFAERWAINPPVAWSPTPVFGPPTEAKQLSRYLVCGPLCRRVEDVLPILRALAGSDGVDTVVRDDWSLDEPAISIFAT